MTISLSDNTPRVSYTVSQGATQTSSQSQVLSPLNTERQMLMSGKENTDNITINCPYSSNNSLNIYN